MDKKTCPVNTMEQEILSDRFKEEMKRWGLTFAQVAKLCGVSKNTAISWGQGAKIPAEALAALMREGLDVFYVLAGRDKNAPQPVMLAPDEMKLVDSYRDASEDVRSAARAMLRASAESNVRKGTARGVREKKKAG